MLSDFILIFRLLASGFSYPCKENLSPTFFRAVEKLAENAGIETGGLLFSPDELKEAYTRLFINSPGGIPAPLYASVYVSGQGLLMQDGYGQARAFYLRAGIEPASEEEPADSLPMELLFVAILLEKEALDLLSEFLGEHLRKWFQLFEQRVQAADPHPYYSLLARLTLFYLTKLNEEVIG